MKKQVLSLFTVLICGMLSPLHADQQAANLKHEPSDRMVVHEWGTFTELQSLSGESLAGINTDDEPVPKFVHGFGRGVIVPTQGPIRMKSIIRRHPQITMRLETPVIYFYPPAGSEGETKVDVNVKFVDGWLSEFYPKAEFDAPGYKQNQLSKGTVSQLNWRGLRINTNKPGPKTSDPVWTTPRQTDAVSVTTAEGESESYLFYRGVGNFSGPLRVETHLSEQQLAITANPTGHDVFQSACAWLVDIQKDGKLAFRTIGSLELTAHNKDEKRVARDFAAEDYSLDNLPALKLNMQAELVSAGLYEKEAAAMLGTWEQAYFKSPGLRLFYVVPRRWTDSQMPLTLSQPCDIERVMVGRIELISDAQFKILHELAKMPVTPFEWQKRIPKSTAGTKFFAGRSDFGDLGVPIPADYQAYLNLGRFRNPLVRYAAAKSGKGSNIAKFIKVNGLQAPNTGSPPAKTADSKTKQPAADALTQNVGKPAQLLSQEKRQ